MRGGKRRKRADGAQERCSSQQQDDDDLVVKGIAYDQMLMRLCYCPEAAGLLDELALPMIPANDVARPGGGSKVHGQVGSAGRAGCREQSTPTFNSLQ